MGPPLGATTRPAALGVHHGAWLTTSASSASKRRSTPRGERRRRRTSWRTPTNRGSPIAGRSGAKRTTSRSHRRAESTLRGSLVTARDGHSTCGDEEKADVADEGPEAQVQA